MSVSRPDGSQLHLGYHLVPVALLDGAGRIVIFRDIGPLLAADARRRRAERLAQVGETAAKLVHDLKNPLAGILTGLRILERDTSVPQAQRPLLARTAAQVHELSSLASQFLDQARPARPAPRLLPARQEIRQALEPLELAASGFGVRLELLLSEEPILLALDPSDFRRALGNLVHNAIEASPRGGTVTVELAPLGPREIATRLRGFPGLVAAVRVRDQGTGLAPGQLARIFEPFYSTKPAGTGLGLPIAREIIEAHGGTLDVLPAGGTGTTFEILLPSGTRPRCSESVRCGDCGDCPVNRTQANFCCWAAQSDGSCQRGRPDRCLECSYYLRYNLNGYLQSTGAQTP